MALGGFKLDTNGRTLTVTVTTSSGGTPTCYTTADGSVTQSLPATVSSDTSFFFSGPEELTVSIKTALGTEIASSTGTTVPFSVRNGQFTELGTRRVEPDYSDESTSALSGTYAQQWKATTAYTAGQVILAPTGEIVTPAASFTSGSVYDPSNWRVLSAPGTLAEAVPLLVKLKRQQANAVLVVMSDSTGLGDTTSDRRWVYKVAQGLAAAWPTHTVRIFQWDPSGVTYLAAVTIQTGTGARTLDVYNGSAPGQAVSYGLTNLNALTPVAPDLTIVAYGENDSTTSIIDRLTGLTPLVKALRSRYPKTAVALMSQAPQTTASANYAAQLSVRQIIAEQAAREGHGFLDVTSAFMDYPSWETALIGVDTVHPTTLGYTLWAAVVLGRLVYSAQAPVRASRQIDDTVWVPASQFGPVTDTIAETAPSYAAAGASALTYGPAWAFDPASTESVSAWVNIPESWNSWDTYLYWTTYGAVGGNAGTAIWNLYTVAIPTTGFPATLASATQATTGVRGTAIAGTDGAKVVRESWLWSNGGFTTKGHFGLRVFRFANNGSDTLGIKAQFLGMKFQRLD